LIELIMVVVLLGFVSITAIPFYYNLKAEAASAAEKGVVGAVRTGILTYFAANKSYPMSLDSGSLEVCSAANTCFETVLAQGGVTSSWAKASSLSYLGPTGDTYVYDPITGSFLPASASILNFSDFNSGTATGWQTTMGSAVVQDGAYVLSGSQGRSFTGDTSWDDYTIDTDATLTQGNGYGLFFRVTDPSSLTGYSFQYDAGWLGGSFIMRQWTAGHEANPFAVATAPLGFQWRDIERHITVKVQGNTFTTFIDGQQVLTGTNSAYASGQVGLRTWTNGSAEFDNFQVSTD
jgi:type II secretory pathway pseudopilin PulG